MTARTGSVRYTLSPRASRDLAEIFEFTARRWGVGQAGTYARRLGVHMSTIAADPQAGEACDDVRPGYRRHRAEGHVIFYRTAKGGVTIIRILHARMEFRRHL